MKKCGSITVPIQGIASRDERMNKIREILKPYTVKRSDYSKQLCCYEIVNFTGYCHCDGVYFKDGEELDEVLA